MKYLVDSFVNHTMDFVSRRPFTACVGPVGLEPTKVKTEGFTVPCNCRYAITPILHFYALNLAVVYEMLTVNLSWVRGHSKSMQFGFTVRLTSPVH